MAYTIISQNNTTTTLADENGNVITVPARVTLATSTDYTITKVNNNSVDLVDGNGKVIRGVPACVVLAGGGNSHNLGYYATQAALEEAHPTAEAGDWAIVGATDTVWIWDEDNSEWKDSDQKGQVTSVNNQTGDVTITAASISALPTSGGTSTGDIVFSKTGHNDKVVGNHNGDFRIGTSTTPSNDDLFVSTGSGNNRSIAFGSGNGGQLGSSTAKFERTYTQKLNNGADIEIPVVAGKMAEQVLTMPTASVDELGNIYQFTGTTDATYTNGYFYKCVSDGQEPATYSWTQVNVQPAPSGLPDQTGQSGKFLTTDGTDASWSDKPLVNNATGAWGLATGTSSEATQQNSVAYGSFAKAKGVGSIAVGNSSSASQTMSVAIGTLASATASGAIQISARTAGATNSDANTFKVGNANGNFEIMSADGTIPEARLADTTNAAQGQVLTLDSNLNAVWQAGGGGQSIKVITDIVDSIENGTLDIDEPFMCFDTGYYYDGDGSQFVPFPPAGTICTVQEMFPKSFQSRVDQGDFTVILTGSVLENNALTLGYSVYPCTWVAADNKWSIMIGTLDGGTMEEEFYTTEQLATNFGITVSPSGSFQDGDSFVVEYYPPIGAITNTSQPVCTDVQSVSVTADNWSEGDYENHCDVVLSWDGREVGNNPIVNINLQTVTAWKTAGVGVTGIHISPDSQDGYQVVLQLYCTSGTPALTFDVSVMPRWVARSGGGANVMITSSINAV